MIGLLLAICVITFIVCSIAYSRNHFNNVADSLLIVSGIVGVFLLVTFLMILVCYVDSSRAHQRIDMLVEHNSEIETKVRDTVRVYLEHEKDVLPNIENTNLMTLLIIYPELNSYNLISHEIELYITNSNEIKQHKNKLIDRDIFSWWLWFV